MTQPMGVWEPLVENALGIVGAHAVVLRTGKVLYFSFDSRAVGLLPTDSDKFVSLFNNPELGSYQVWDPVTKMALSPPKPIGRNSFCAGQCVMADGTVLVVGGQDAAGAIELNNGGNWIWDPNFWSSWWSAIAGTDNGALKDVHTYDPISDTWTRWPNLGDGRYYPSCLILPDGRGFIAGGLSNLQQWVATGSNSAENDQFETVLPGELFAGPTPQRKFMGADQYPIIRLLPGTHKLFVYVETTTFIFDLDSSSFVDGFSAMPPGVGRQTYPMQTGHVLLPQKQGDPPRILIVGGSTAAHYDFNTQDDKPAVRQAFIFDFDLTTTTNSKWRTTTGRPNVARLLADTVLLPDGTVFVVNGIGGGAAAGNSKRFPTRPEAEIFDPVTETFLPMASNPRADHPRGYHSTAVLLPDARVAVAGNTGSYNPDEHPSIDDVTIQIFDPPYLFNGPRPVVGAVPAQVGYGSTISVDTSAGPPVAKVMMMRPCAVTHTVDMDQRAIWLETTGGAGSINITFPTDKSLAPPGFYMLFFLTAGMVPSVASFVSIADATPIFFPLDLGTYSGSGYMLIEEVFDGDLTLEKIDAGTRVTLESRHGSITIKDKISDRNTYANLKAATFVKIGSKIDQGATVQIDAGGDVTIGQSIDEGASATISAGGKVDIGQKVDAYSAAYVTAGGTVHIGQTIDQHSNVTISAQGDVSIGDKIDQHATVTITSVHGAIRIGQKIDQGSFATLNAATTVDIGQKIDQGARAEIVAGGDVTIGQAIDQGANATITSTSGRIEIGTKVDAASTARLTAGTTVHIGETLDQHSNVTIVAQGDVTIEKKIDQHTTANVTSVHGSIIIREKVDQWSLATLTAGSTVNIGQKLDQHATVTIAAQGDVTIGQKIDQHVTATINSANGSVNLGQGMSGNATATITAPNGDINIGDSVDGGCTLNWSAHTLNCPHQDGTINHI